MLFRTKNVTPEEKFWNWFKKNSKSLLKIDGEAIVHTIATELHKYDEGLVELISPTTTQPRELIISADGHTSNIDAVEKLCDAAPDIPGWKIIRFRPRFPDGGDGIKYQGITVDIDGVQFVAYYEEPKIGVEIFAHWRNPEDGDRPDGPAFLLLDHTIGEYEVMCGIGFIGVHPLENAPDNAKPWSEFADLFDENWTHVS